MRSRLLAPTDEITNIALEINRRLIFRGPWFFQLKRDASGHWKLLEIAARVAGSMVSHRAQGINLPLLTVLDIKGYEVNARANPGIELVDRFVATKFDFGMEFETAYFDLDDTLIINGSAVPVAIAFVYLMIQQGKRVVLITRHAFDLNETLARTRISASLFDEIIHITDGSSKADHIQGQSIFIDNHYPERLAVSQRHGIPVFDVDALEFFTR
ncbi:hypothetical protein EC912_103449 [Luteibacter rhizovicinus]|uniref:Uncharacterized protein n=2 Tax=Luteibacter rhizovicinus TaxID=242606 RepID=A0A4R3YRF5_9GAMM|nr:hypothetical protein EC912_103449 [Luteibacter rhizovicinus]